MRWSKERFLEVPLCKVVHDGRHLWDVECGMRGSVGFESVSFSLIVLLSSALAFHSKGIASSVCPDFVVTLTLQ